MSRNTTRFVSVSSWGVCFDPVLERHVIELCCDGPKGAITMVRIAVSRFMVENLAHALGSAIEHEQRQQALMLECVDDEIRRGKG